MPAIFCSMHLMTSLTNPLVAHALKPPLPFKRSANISSDHSGIGGKDQFSYLDNRARYEFIELDMSTGLNLSIPSSRSLTFPGGQSENGYRARWLIELGDLSSSVFQEKKKREKMEIKAITTTWSTKSKTPSRSQFVTDKKHCVAGRLMYFWRRVF